MSHGVITVVSDNFWKEIRRHHLSPLFIYNLQNIFDLCIQHNLDGESFSILEDIIKSLMEDSEFELNSNSEEDFSVFYQELLLVIEEIDPILSDFFSKFVVSYIDSPSIDEDDIEGELNKGFDLVPYDDAGNEGDDLDSGEELKSVIVISEYTEQYLTVGFSHEFRIEEVELYDKFLTFVKKPLFYRFDLRSLRASCYLPKYIEQKKHKDGYYRLYNEKGEFLPWPNVYPCLFCTISTDSIEAQRREFGLDDNLSYRSFFTETLASMGLTLDSSACKKFTKGMQEFSQDEELAARLYQIKDFLYLEEFFSGKDLLSVEGIGKKTQYILVQNGFRLKEDLLERSKDVIRLLGKKGYKILNNVKENF